MNRINRHRREVLRYGAALALVNVMGGPVMGSGAMAATRHRILALGDSLTAGFGLAPDQAFPVRLEQALRAEGRDVTLINAGVSGDTSAGGKARLDWALAARPDLAIVELGANDGLRGLDPALTRANLSAILNRLKADGVGILLTGMRAPPNYGKVFEAEFQAVFPALAAEHGVLFYPFFLDGVAGDSRYNQSDGLHPNAKGVDIIVERILPMVRKLLERAKP